MDMIIWNCRGTGNARFRRTLRELVSLHKPDMLVLMETKVELHTMGMFFNNLGYTASTHVDPIGRSGGIWILWNPSQANVRVHDATSQMITATISRQEYLDWVLSTVYASPNIRMREELWNGLEDIAQNIQEPWLVAGDFNDYSSSEEKKKLPSCVGPRLTWTNNRKGWANTMVRLDRALCNTEWRTLFPEGIGTKMFLEIFLDVNVGYLEELIEFKFLKPIIILTIFINWKAYFQNIFAHTPISNLHHWNNLTKHINVDDQLDMIRELSAPDIWRAVKNIKAFKAPGRDGYQAIFYHTFWGIVGQFFRPISLCNVTYKIISKILVNRIRPILSDIISPNQSSFIPGRSTHDNIIITQEAIHTVNKKKGKIGFMIFKVDLEKAYDNISWNFLRQTLLEFHFDEKLVTMIMNCVTSVSTAILWNGEPLDEFKPAKGLRQGDSLSPYLFVLCMERLSAMITQKVQEKEWNGLCLAKSGPTISHLFFTDDLILFAKANDRNCHTILQVLTEFSAISGLKVNLHESHLFVSPNINRRRALQLSNMSSIPLTQNLGKYLGVPLLHDRVSKSHFLNILEKLKSKLTGWKSGMLSLAGRATLIQSVTSAMPAYAMHTMELPRKVCDEIDKINRNFLWGDTREKRKVHLANWDQVCKLKKDGGLGLRKARDTNLALLSNLGWKMLNEDNTLWVEVLKTKYLGQQPFLSKGKGKSISHTWKGILNTRDLLVKGIRWKLGRGSKVRVWKDWWCGDGAFDKDLQSPTNQIPNFEAITVDSLLDENGEWDLNPIHTSFPLNMVEEILKLQPLQTNVGEDTPRWMKSSDEESLHQVRKLKLNTDGSTRRLGGGGGFGGLFRDETGSWISGYYGRVEIYTSLKAELWAVYKGLTIILQRGFNQVILETDAEQVVQLLSEDLGERCPFLGHCGRCSYYYARL
ncbi:uncharacterized protein LOC114292475 [Camellia sinensis]|uniref:uncharacterized protein LOC114292475 n=1 Tax=Camellia sinensis TaxID=4442 RepID=UPI001035CF56|nr:uncharacterized protein LOC114292475 [Camellia sinensis]